MGDTNYSPIHNARHFLGEKHTVEPKIWPPIYLLLPLLYTQHAASHTQRHCTAYVGLCNMEKDP